MSGGFTECSRNIKINLDLMCTMAEMNERVIFLRMLWDDWEKSHRVRAVAIAEVEGHLP